MISTLEHNLPPSASATLLDSPDLITHFASHNIPTKSTAEFLLSQQSPLERLLADGEPVLDPDIDNLVIDIGESNDRPIIKPTQDRLAELGLVAAGAVPFFNQRIYTLDVDKTNELQLTTRTLVVGSTDNFIDHIESYTTVVPLNLRKDSELAGSITTTKTNLPTSGQTPAQPLEPTQPPVKSPVGGLNVAQTGLEPRSQHRDLKMDSILPFTLNKDLSKTPITEIQTIQRDRIKPIDVQPVDRLLSNAAN